MTRLLDEAIGSMILLEIESEQRWAELCSRSESADLLSRLADEALREHHAGGTQKLSLCQR